MLLDFKDLQGNDIKCTKIKHDNVKGINYVCKNNATHVRHGYKYFCQECMIDHLTDCIDSIERKIQNTERISKPNL